MGWEYRILEPTDYSHPGAGQRFGDFVEELNKLAKEGWEVVQLTPSMMRGRVTKSSGKDTPVTMTTVTMCALLRRKVE